MTGFPTLTLGPDVTVRGTTFTIGTTLVLHFQYGAPFGLNLDTRGSIEASPPAGLVTVSAGYSTFSGAWTNSGSVLAQSGSTLSLSSSASFNSGSILATGATVSVSGWLTNAGTIHLDAHSLMTATNGFHQTAQGVLGTDISGLAAGASYGQLQISGQAALDGRLDVGLVGGFLPSSGDTFDLITWTSQTGSFGTITVPPVGTGLVLKAAYQATSLRVTTGPP
jgi:hypothetical protein